MKKAYETWNPRGATLQIVQQADTICREFEARGYNLTLRQLYYQFVARGLLPNKQTVYKNLGAIINRARLAGLIDWNHIVDRTRNLAGGDLDFGEPADAMMAMADGYKIPLWENQATQIEVWVEKEALADVVGQAANRYRVPFFSCRGYVSQSEMWSAARRIERKLRTGADQVIVLHLGDHDPSGMDMTRDITDRLNGFLIGDGFRPWDQLEVRRIALTMEQIQQYDPPPNPAKETDIRFAGYAAEFGDESWELDSLDPGVIDDLIIDNITEIYDAEAYEERLSEEEDRRSKMRRIAKRWDEFAAQVEDETEVDPEEEG